MDVDLGMAINRLWIFMRDRIFEDTIFLKRVFNLEKKKISFVQIFTLESWEMRCGSKKAIESRAVSPRISKMIFKRGYPRQNQFPSGNNLQGECLYRWKSTAGWNVSIGHSTDTANCASSFSCLSQGRFRFPRKPVPPPPPPLRRRRRRPRASRGEQTSEDKVRARPATIFTLDTQIYLAPILNLDRSPLSVSPA